MFRVDQQVVEAQGRLNVEIHLGNHRCFPADVVRGHVRGYTTSSPLSARNVSRRLPSLHQMRQALARTIFCPAWQPNACQNSGRFETTLLTRYLG